MESKIKKGNLSFMKKITFLIISAFILASCATTNKIETQPKTTEKTLQNEDDILFEKLKKSLYENNVNLFTETVDETPPIQMRRIINRQDTDGKTLLHRAVLSENFKITKILISAKADENIKDLNGYSPKYYAENARTPEIRELFGFKKNSEQLEIQPEENISEKKSAATFYGSKQYKVVFGEANSELIKAVKEQNFASVSKMLRSGKNVNEADTLGNNALFYAIDSQNDGLINLLVSYKINCNKKNNHGQLPFLFAVSKGNVNEISTLIKTGVNINKKDNEGVNAVMLAIYSRNLSLLKFLIANGAYPEGTDLFGNTLLHIAIQNEDANTTKFLINQDCDIHAPNDKGTTPLDLLKSSKNEDLQSIAKIYE